MLHSVKAAMVFSGALALGLFLGAASHASPVPADAVWGPSAPSAQEVKQAPPPPPDPNKKNEGEECKKSDECQKHHTCTKQGDKSVCKAPPPPRLPPGAVT